MDIDEVIADESMQETGIWIPFRDGAEFLIAYSGRKKYRDKIGKLSARERRKNRGRELTAAEADAVTIEAMIDTVLLNWRGITKAQADFPFSRMNADWWLKRSPELRDFIFAEANNLSNFQPEGGEEASSPLADTKSSTDMAIGENEGSASVAGHGTSGIRSSDPIGAA
jgi:hypothetical protein